jgi:hypothetical protein
MSKTKKAILAIITLAFGLLIMATVSPELFNLDQTLKALPQLLQMIGAK